MTVNNIRRIFIFLGLLLVSNYLISSFLINHDAARIAQIEARNAILREPRITTLIMGDSQALRGVNPHKFNTAYNYAAMGENGILTYYKLNDLLKQRHDIRDLILVVNLHSFSDYRGDFFSKIYVWRDVVNFVELSIAKRDPVIMFNLLKSYFFAYEHMARGAFQSSSISKQAKPILLKADYYKGFAPMTFDRFNDVTDRTERYFNGKTIYDPVLIKYHQKIFDLCKKHSITVHLVRMPISKEFYNKSLQYLDDQQYLSIIHGFQYDNLRFYDLIDLYAHDRNLFFDDLHLNHFGANQVSNKLSALMYKPTNDG